MKSRQQTFRPTMPPAAVSMRGLRHAHSGSRRGFSLLEILVVLVVLLIGIISVLQLFPGGFLTIARTGEQTLATQLANQQLEAMRALPVQPDNIVPALPDNNGNIHVISSIRPDDFAQETDTSIADYSNGSKSNSSDQFTLAAGYGGYFFSDIDRWRYIKGETLHVPVANPNIKNSNQVPIGSFYTVQFGPVYNVFNADATKNPNGCSIKVYGQALTRTLQSSLATLNQPDNRAVLPNDNQYAIDYQNHQIAFFPRVGKPGQMTPKTRLFTISLDYYNTSSNPPVVMHLTGSIPVPDLDPAAVASGVAPQPVWQEIFTAANFPGMTLPSATDQSNIRAESEDVSRQFKLITTDSMGTATQTFIGATNGPQWSDDPYEFAWYTAQQGGALNANPGTLLFNPNGYLSFSTNGNVTDVQTQIAGASYASASAIVARIDYLTYDNHIIRDQRTMPSSGPYTIKLSLPNLLSQGDLLDDASTYNGIFQGSSSATSDILVIDANDGTLICDIQQGSAVGNSLIPIDSLNPVAGTITFRAIKHPTTNPPPNPPIPEDNLPGVEDLNLQGRPLRILYRTQQSWGQQVQKASGMYTPATSPSQVTYTTYFVGDGTNGSATRIYFAPSESGKTINIGEFYLMTGTGSIFTPYKNETFQILDDPSQYDALNLPYIDILSTHKQSDSQHLANGATGSENITGFSAKPTGRAINLLRGLSIKSRVMWKSSSRFRRIDQDSILPTDRL